MPMIECTLIKGYEKDTRQLLAERVTDAASSTIGAHPDQVIVTIKEVPATNYMRGRVTRMPAAAPKQPDILVREYLNAMEQRDLELAKQYLDKDSVQRTFTQQRGSGNTGDKRELVKNGTVDSPIGTPQIVKPSGTVKSGFYGDDS